MSNYLENNAHRCAKLARWHIQNALDSLHPCDGANFELAANSLINAGQELYNAAIQVRALYEKTDASGGNPDKIAEKLSDAIYKAYFAELKPAHKIEL